MTKTDIAARAAQLAARRSHTDVSIQSGPDTERKGLPRVKPIRITTDLDPQSYRRLVAYCAQLAERAGLARVAHTSVVRALVEQLENDEALKEKIATLVS